jgi:hypothetical protein
MSEAAAYIELAKLSPPQSDERSDLIARAKQLAQPIGSATLMNRADDVLANKSH